LADLDKIHQQKQIQDLKLTALLEVTKAINNNLSTKQLLELYQDILQKRLGVGRLVLFLFHNDSWSCILKYGLIDDLSPISFEVELLKFKEIESITYNEGDLTKNFEIVIPVFHKQQPLAYVLLSDVNPLHIEMSAAIKHLPFVQTLTNLIVVAIENKKLFKENIERVKIIKELELAQSMQQMLFPQHLPNTESLQVAAKYLPHQQVGGDYYDFLQLNNHEFIFCIADVSGKGIPAALLMSNIQATLHSLINYTHNLKDIILELNKRVISNTHSEKFVSLFLGKINTKSQQFTYINAGHNPPILLYENKFSELSKGCTLLGVMENLRDIEVENFEYASNFSLLCYTDGLTDNTNQNNETVSIDDLKRIITQFADKKPEEINTALFNFAEDFKGDVDFPDDIALLTLKVSDLSF
jgi:sigma-B regulation protein RsbU (phosphoserine phosphatase)